VLLRLSSLSAAACDLTTEQARWYTPRYKASAFLFENLRIVRKFFAKQSGPGATEIVKFLDENRGCITLQLLRDTCSLKPLTNFLEVIGKPGMSVAVYGQVRRMLRMLRAAPEGSYGKALLPKLEAHLNFALEAPLTPTQRTLKLFFYCALLNPGGRDRLDDDPWYVAATQRGLLTPAHFAEALGFPASQFPMAEMAKFWELHNDEVVTCEVTWWADHVSEYPQLAPVALYLYRLPCVVTSCDSVLGFVKEFVSQRHAHSVETAARLIAMRANGDVQNACGDAFKKSFM
jgi:hypothetical protein